MNAAAVPHYWAVLAAAGGGRRMRADRPKQYLRAAGRTLLEHSLRVLESARWIEGIIVALAPDDAGFDQAGIAPSHRLHRMRGGATRAETVLAALREIPRLTTAPAGHTFVLVHDAARPCITAGDLERLRDEATDEHGGLLAVPVADTLKRDEGGRSAATVDRRGLWRAQTPQMFRLDLLGRAMEDCAGKGIEVTDEAAAMEAAGYRPKLVSGHEGNVKVTYPGDLAMAEYWLARQKRDP